ncbi:MAG: ATP-binding protein [Acidimicrobiales bacterium]
MFQPEVSGELLRLLVEGAPFGMFMTDSENKFIYTNPRWSEITGLPADQVLGRSRSDIIEAQYLAGHISRVPDVSEDGSELSFRTEIEIPGCPSRIVQVNSKSIPGFGGESMGWIGTVVDVTCEVHAEAAIADARDKATEASRLKSEFLSNVSHEIRTPMNGVIGMTELLLGTDLDSRQREFAQVVRTSGEALLAIINEILDFSRLEKGTLEIENTRFSIREVVADAVRSFAEPAQEKGLVLEAAVANSVPRFVYGDPGRLRQVLTNLIENAVKFTQVGEVVVVVTAMTALDDTDAVIRFEVSDTGDGVEPDKLDMIFQPFVQADSSAARRHEGTGLGLSICAQLVALMGGRCEVSSEVGVGSTFSFTISAYVADPAKACLSELPGSPAPVSDFSLDEATDGADGSPLQSLSLGKILLVEDNLTNQKVAVAMLWSAGYSVDAVNDGVQAVKAATAGRYDAVLMDCQMPGMDGYEATAAIREQEGSSRHTPIIALTAGARGADRNHCLSAGMDGYLAKPINKDSLIAIVSEFVVSGT